MFVVRHILVEFLGGDILFGNNVALAYLNNSLNYIAVALSFVLSVLSYFITMLCFRRKNAKAANGGALEYEFV